MKNFGDLPPEYSSFENSSIVILPVAYDGTSTWKKGADKGPEAILEASANMELYDIQTGTEVYKKGIYTAPVLGHFTTPEEMVSTVKKEVARLGNDKFPVIIGGEHSVSIGPIQAMAEKYPNLTVLQIDAHTDLRDSYLGSPYNHACVMARASEVAQIVQIGIRSMDISEWERADINRIFFAHQIMSGSDWMDKVLDLLTEHVYITIDLDGFDPSIVPATGTPEPGGLDWYTVNHLLEKVVAKTEIAGFDVVELCPNPYSQPSDFLAAKLIYRLLSMIFKTNKK